MDTETTAVTVPSEQPADQPTLSQAEILRAATNDPALSTDVFILGSREFKLLDLDYDRYLEFIALLQPLLDAVVSKFAERAKVSLPGIELYPEGGFNVSHLMKFCKQDLPEMVRIMCNMTDKTVTVAWVKSSARTPLHLAAIVMKQINRNRIISDFMDFFVQMLPALASLGMVKTQEETTPSESTISETLSS